MIEIKDEVIAFEVNTPFGKAKITCCKEKEKIVVNFNHPLISKTFEADKTEAGQTLEEICKWIKAT